MDYIFSSDGFKYFFYFISTVLYSFRGQAFGCPHFLTPTNVSKSIQSINSFKSLVARTATAGPPPDRPGRRPLRRSWPPSTAGDGETSPTSHDRRRVRLRTGKPRRPSPDLHRMRPRPGRRLPVVVGACGRGRRHPILVPGDGLRRPRSPRADHVRGNLADLPRPLPRAAPRPGKPRRPSPSSAACGRGQQNRANLPQLPLGATLAGETCPTSPDLHLSDLPRPPPRAAADGPPPDTSAWRRPRLRAPAAGKASRTSLDLRRVQQRPGGRLC